MQKLPVLHDDSLIFCLRVDACTAVDRGIFCLVELSYFVYWLVPLRGTIASELLGILPLFAVAYD